MFGGLISRFLEHMLYFALHLDSTTVFPKPLSAEREAEAFRRMAEGDASARSELIEHNLRLVAHVVKKYYSPNADSEELISIGTIGLIKAVNSFNNSKSARFATYAAKCIENAVIHKRKHSALIWYSRRPFIYRSLHHIEKFWRFLRPIPPD